MVGAKGTWVVDPDRLLKVASVIQNITKTEKTADVDCDLVIEYILSKPLT